MDAIRNPLSNKVFIVLAAVLLAAVPAAAAGSLIVNGATSDTVALNGSNTSSSVLAGSTGDPIPFTSSIDYNGGAGPQNWLSVNASGTTPAWVYLQMVSAPSPIYGSGPFTATITLTDTVAIGDVATITVTFTPGPGTGPGGAISLSPSYLGLQLSTAGSVQGTLTVQSSIVTSTSFTVGASSTVPGWSLSVDKTSGTVSASSPFTITVTASTALATGATYTGTVTLTPSGLSPVQVSVTLAVSGSSGVNTDLTLTNGAVTASNVTLTATYNTGDAVPSTIATLPVQSAGGQVLYQVLSIAYQSGANWLTAGNLTPPATYLISSPLALSTSAGVSALADGVYQATVSLCEISGGNSGPVLATVVVTLYKNTATASVSASPSSWALQIALNGAPQTQTFTITTNSSVTLESIGADSTWIHVGALGSGGSLPVTVDPTGLAATTYNGNVIVGSTAANSPLLIPISMTVSSIGGAVGGQVVAPGSLSFAYQIGGPALSPPTVTIPGAAGQTFGATADQAWIGVSPTSGPLPASMLVYISPASLAAQAAPYTANITITTANGVAVIPVTLLVTASRVVLANPGSLTFADSGSGSAAQKVDFSASDGSALTIGASALNTPWVHFTLAPNAATKGQTLTVTADATAMATGVFAGAIQVSASGFAGSPVNYPVVLVTNGGGNGQGGSLTLSSNALTFYAAANGQASAQTLTVGANTGATPFTLSFQMYSGAGWLAVTPTGDLTTSQDITVSADPSSLGIGNYGGAILLTAYGATQQVPVSLLVGSSSTGSGVQAVPSSLSLAYQMGGTAPSAQLQVSNTLSGSAQIAFTVSTPNSSWLTATPLNAQTSATIAVGVNTAGLTAGPYNGTIRITPAGGQPLDVPVTLTVTTPTIAVATTSLTFTYHEGDPQPTPQYVQVTGGANANFTAQPFVTSCACPPGVGPVFSVTPVSGIANPATLTVSVNPTGLAAGNYQGGITVTGVNGATGSATVNVTLNVLAPNPVIAGLANAASGYSASVAPGELISIYGTELGPLAPVSTQLDSSGKYVATTLGGVQVTVGGYAAPVMYVSAGQVNAVVPYEVASLQSVGVTVKFLGQASNAFTLPVGATAPGVFTLNATGSGQGLILNAADYSVNGPAKPAAKGSYVLVYVTGEGATLPAGTTGLVTVAQPAPPYTPGPLLTVVPWVNGQIAYFNFAGEAPGFVSGVMQVNVQIPANAPSGDLPLQVSVGGNFSQTGVTVRVQ